MSDRKDKIKNIAIIFLSIMLVLTFFSNSIMNYSLVEVSTQYVYGGSITTKVRGSGTVEAAEGVSVEADSGRKIETINVKTGAEVEEGDVLFTLGAGDSDALSAAKDAYESARTEYEKAILTAGITVEERKVIESGKLGSLSDRQNSVVAAQAAIEELQKQYDEMTEDIAAKKAERDTAQAAGDTAKVADINYYLGEISWKYEEVKKQLDEAKESGGLTDKYIQQITLSEQYKNLCELSQKVTELEGKGTGSEVKAPMAGTITQINYYAGQTIKEDNVVMTMSPENEAFTLQFTVSAAQARRIKAGDPAEVMYNWYGNDVTARVQSVRKDPMNKESYIVICEMNGDVSVGDNYTLSIGQQSSNYDYIVPTSCIREDSNGKFILIVEAKSTPLGNRYYARRRDVEVITSDDSQSAIVGALEGYEYVITTTTKPVEENQQVRLADE